jgi:hypothetical protein
MQTLTPALLAALLYNLELANPVALLVTAEEGAMAAIQAAGSGGPLWPPTWVQGAYNAVAQAVGYPLSNYGYQDQTTIISVIGSFMVGLRYLAQGPATPQNPLSNTYSFVL